MKEKREIAVITSSRADYGIYKPVLNELKKSQKIEYYLVVTGTHLSEKHGYTISQIEAHKHPIKAKLDILAPENDSLSIANTMSNATAKFGEFFNSNKPDILIVLADRYEMFAATLAAVPFNIPIAHIHGGEASEGAIDDVFRHALTKISHIHFCSTKLSKQRIIQMGENPEFVFDFGAPSLDSLNDLEIIDKKQLLNKYNIPENKNFALVTYHPVTKELSDTQRQINNLLSALKNSNLFIVFTLANADTNGEIINNSIKSFVNNNPEIAIIADNLGTQNYFSMMNYASVIIGNSSSGIIEAASFKTPVVNIGNRQKGREQSKNIVNCGYEVNELSQAIKKAISEEFKTTIQIINNIYGNSTAAENIVKILEECDIEKAFNKSFHLLNEK